MADLSTQYCGIPLKNPLLAGSSALTGNLTGLKKLAEAGVAGVVLKSLFEEQIQAEVGMADEYSHPEAYDFLSNQAMALAPADYVKLIGDARSSTSLVVWASLNCLDGSRWQQYAKEIESAGAHGLELNIAPQLLGIGNRPGEAENRIIETVKRVRGVTTLPLSVKLGREYGSLPWLLDQLMAAGAQGAVLFNRFYKTDMDIEKMTLKTGSKTSVPSDFLDTLRWTAILAPQKTLEICASGGIHSSSEVIKALLAGASAVQVTSLFYSKGVGAAQGLLTELGQWMDKREFKTLKTFQGTLSRSSDQGSSFDRTQYIKALTGVE